MKSNRILLWSIGVLLLIAIGYAWYTSQHKAATTGVTTVTAPSSSVPGIVITSKTITASDVAKTYQITVTYPIVSGMTSTRAESAINKNMLAVVQADESDFKSNLNSNPDAPASADDQSTLNITFATTSDPVPSLISFTIDQNVYSAGAAHPGDQVDAYTFDTTSGDQLYLADLLQGNYLQTLSTYSAQALTTQLGDDADSDQIAEGTAATEDNFKVFVPHTDGLHIIFNQYQVASFADGIQEITIPYATLQSVINKNAQLGSFVQ